MSSSTSLPIKRKTPTIESSLPTVFEVPELADAILQLLPTNAVLALRLVCSDFHDICTHRRWFFKDMIKFADTEYLTLTDQMTNAMAPWVRSVGFFRYKKEQDSFSTRTLRRSRAEEPVSWLRHVTAWNQLTIMEISVPWNDWTTQMEQAVLEILETKAMMAQTNNSGVFPQVVRTEADERWKGAKIRVWECHNALGLRKFVLHSSHSTNCASIEPLLAKMSRGVHPSSSPPSSFTPLFESLVSFRLGGKRETNRVKVPWSSLVQFLKTGAPALQELSLDAHYVTLETPPKRTGPAPQTAGVDTKTDEEEMAQDQKDTDESEDKAADMPSTPVFLGSVLSLGPTILPALEQLGLLEDIQKISLTCPGVSLLDQNMKRLGDVKIKGEKDLSGYDSVVFARRDFHALLLGQVPPENISFNKKVLKTTEEDGKVTIHMSDNTAYECDIVVGADGTYSSVRQAMFKKLSEKGMLPKSDAKELVAGYTYTCGVSAPLDPEKYPQLEDDDCHFDSVIGGLRHSWNVIKVPGNRVCWGLGVQFENPEESRKQMFRNSEWSPDTNNSVIDEFSPFPSPYGHTMGDLIKATPKDQISRVFLEYKMFKTWHHGRSVLIGDACHKLLPAYGQGAVNAMQDSVILANCLYDLEDCSQESITACFQSYYVQRFPRAKEAYEMSKVVSKVTNGQKWHERLIRWILFNLPDSFQQRTQVKKNVYRPQASFLPLVPNRGTGKVLPQVPSKRYQKEQEALKKVSAPRAVVV
ncbi:hypothetical protein EMPS_03765 [Entomortierella parvispora]|uniref:FAD-binding domain-containing protein n=1 Tax=Entomortierella parvispora TaxID=205924 RepID=A0A9P3H7B8_9FUNG|nr:hypothetical protein EMPS_03765 [Entomortierella parvispora]